MGEEAVDDGGPRREFLTLVLQEMAADGNIFQGLPHSRFLLHNVQALAARKFFLAGMLVAVSLANGGPGLACLSEALYNYLCFGALFEGRPCVSYNIYLPHTKSIIQLITGLKIHKLIFKPTRCSI